MITPMKAARLAIGKSQQECAIEYAVLTDTEPNQSRWSRLECDEDLHKRQYITVWVIGKVLRTSPELLVKEEHRQRILDRMKGKKK